MEHPPLVEQEIATAPRGPRNDDSGCVVPYNRVLTNTPITCRKIWPHPILLSWDFLLDIFVLYEVYTVTLIINGTEVNRATGCAPRKGRIILTSEGSEIHFRNIELIPHITLRPGHTTLTVP